jgi:acetyl esterase/lipase
LCLWPAPLVAQYLSAQDVLSAEPVEPDFVLTYGPDPDQFGHLRLPAGSGPYPVLVVIHGGCWLSFADLEYMGRFAADLAQAGVATWSIEYRRVDSPGGGWPNTFLDVANGIDHLRSLESDYRLDLGQVVVVGHSAGGHLALWAAGRSKIPEESPLHSATPLPVNGVVSLAGPGQLGPFRDLDNQICGGDVIDQLMGGSPEEVPGHYTTGTPIRMLPLGVPQRLLTGADDPAVPPRFADAYAAAAVEAGDDVTAVTLEGASHFEVIVPGTDVWFEVRSTILSLFGLMSSSDHTPQNRGSPDLHDVGGLVDRGRIKNETGHPPAL